jgi:hypothetical protein
LSPLAELDFAVLANSAQVSSDHLISMLGGGWDTGSLPAEAYPAGTVLTVAMRLLFDRDEMGTHAGEVVVEREDGGRLAALKFAVEVQEPPDDLPAGWKINAPFAVPVPVQFPEPGIYAILVSLGDRLLKRIPLRLKVAGA